jgi:hypothetical protein
MWEDVPLWGILFFCENVYALGCYFHTWVECKTCSWLFFYRLE